MSNLNFKDLEKINLKKVPDILPGDIFSIDDENYISFFYDQCEKGSALAKALGVLRNALSKREPLTLEEVCVVIDAMRKVDFFCRKKAENFTPELYADISQEYEKHLRTSLSVIKITQNAQQTGVNNQDKKLLKAKALVEFYTERINEFQAGAGNAPATPFFATEKPESIKVTVDEPSDSGLFDMLNSSGTQPVKKQAVAEEVTPVINKTSDMEIPGGIAIPIEEPVAPSNEQETIDEPLFEPETEPDAMEEPFGTVEPEEPLFEPETEEPLKLDSSDDERGIFDDYREEYNEEINSLASVEPAEQTEPDYDNFEPEDSEPEPLFESGNTTEPFSDKGSEKDEEFEQKDAKELKPEPEEKKTSSITMLKIADTPINLFTKDEEDDPKEDRSPVVSGVSDMTPEKAETTTLSNIVSETAPVGALGNTVIFADARPCKDIKGFSVIVCKDRSAYIGKTENITGNGYDNTDFSLITIKYITPSLALFLTKEREDVSDFTDEDKSAMRQYFIVVSKVFDNFMGRGATSGEYIRFKQNYNSLVDKVMDTESEKKATYYKALSLTDDFITYLEAYDMELPDSREGIAQSLIEQNTSYIVENCETLKELHVVSDTSKEKLDLLIERIEAFPDDTKKEKEALPELPAEYRDKPIAEELPPGVAMPVYDGPYGGYGGGYGTPYVQPYQPPVSPVNVVINNNVGGYTQPQQPGIPNTGGQS